jgi:hypothetical protein
MLPQKRNVAPADETLNDDPFPQKRRLVTGDDTEEGDNPFRKMAKKPKTNTTELKYNMGNAPELGSDPSSPTPLGKKIKGRATKAALKKKKTADADDDDEYSADKKPMTVDARRKTTNSKMSADDGNATIDPTDLSFASQYKHRIGAYAAGQVRGGGHLRSRHPPASFPAYDEEEDEEYYDEGSYPSTHLSPRTPYAQPEFGTERGRFVDPYSQAHGGRGSQVGYQNRYSDLQPVRRQVSRNPSFQYATAPYRPAQPYGPQHYGPLQHYGPGPQYMGPDHPGFPVLNRNATSFRPTYPPISSYQMIPPAPSSRPSSS